HGSSPGSRELVFDRDGHILWHQDPQRVLGLANQEPGFGAEFTRWQREGSPTRLQGTAVLSEGHVISMSGTRTGDWMVARLITQEHALRPLAVAGVTAWRVGASVAVLAALA